MTRSLWVRSFGITDRGRKRETNEDQFLVAALTTSLHVQQSSLPQSTTQYATEPGNLLIVADGMGGHAAGERASALALSTIEGFLLDTLRWLFTLDEPAPGGTLAELKAALERADARVCDAARRDPRLSGMGTTLTMAFSLGHEVYIAHVGDSRCYLFRSGRLHQLTRDHTLVDQMIQSGSLTAERAATHQLRHVITNCVGGGKQGVQTEVHKLEVGTGDVLLLCTDGVTEMLADEAIASVLSSSQDPRINCEQLVQLANDAGGRDNITAVVAQCG
jgi:protein phosphatase